MPQLGCSTHHHQRLDHNGAKSRALEHILIQNIISSKLQVNKALKDDGIAKTADC